MEEISIVFCVDLSNKRQIVLSFVTSQAATKPTDQKNPRPNVYLLFCDMKGYLVSKKQVVAVLKTRRKIHRRLYIYQLPQSSYTTSNHNTKQKEGDKTKEQPPPPPPPKKEAAPYGTR